MARRIEPEALLDWSEIADRGWKTLLLGNGMSINVSSKFEYKSLFKEADFKGGLSKGDRGVFETFDTQNFEVVLSKLRDAIALAEVMELDPEPYKERFRSVKAALGRTVRKVHLDPREMPEATLVAFQAAFKSHREIISTSYDLLAYWTMSHGNGFDVFGDCFWANDRCEFDPKRPGDGQRIPVYYAHGALHLVVTGAGVTRKLTTKELQAGEERILDRFGKPIPGDPEARPLLVTEGSWRDKLQEIESNDYLSYVYFEKLKQNAKPLLVFGHSLGEQDQHLVDAINANPERPVAISMRNNGRERLREERFRILAALKKVKTTDVYFYDAATHPLGAPEHRLDRPRQRQPKARPKRTRAKKIGFRRG